MTGAATPTAASIELGVSVAPRPSGTGSTSPSPQPGAPLVATWLGVLSPLVALHLLSAAHHDGLLAGLVLAGLAFGANPRTRWMPAAVAGAALGLAAAVKVTAVVAR